MSLKGRLEHPTSAMSTKYIQSVEFSVLSGKHIEKTSVIEVVNRRLYNDEHTSPMQLGPLDVRLGVSGSVAKCETCGKNLSDCPGHCGFIKLFLPVFHIGFFRHSVTILQMICKACSRVLLESRERYLKMCRFSSMDAIRRTALFKSIANECKKRSKCPFCGFQNQKVKKVGLKIIHDKFGDRDSPQFIELKEKLKHVSKIKDLTELLQRPVEEITPMMALGLFERIPPEDIELLGMRPGISHPKDLVLTHIVVPPVCIRPSVPVSEGISNEDDLTVKLTEIINLNQVIRKAMEDGKELRDIFKEWDYLQAIIFQYMNSSTPGLPASLSSGKPIRALFQRLKGKHGRFRGNLSGKRVDFSGRTVISPDPNLLISEVVVPEQMAKILTFPERVTTHNLERLQAAVRLGPLKHPGANEIRVNEGPQHKISLRAVDLRQAANILQIGDVVERHLRDGDFVLFNRQPSLHRISIMAHRVRVMRSKTLRFNESVCAPYNADFDGDEMNVHFPQTYEAQADIQTLMRVTNNILTPKSGEPIVAPTQDFLTCAFLLTQKDVFYDRATFCRYLAYFTDAAEPAKLPIPAVLRPRELWTGKQLFSLVLSPKADLQVSVKIKERNYTKDRSLCRRDGYVLIRNSQLLSGNIGKLTIGGGSKAGLVFALVKNHGGATAEGFMRRMAKLSSRWTMERGITLGISDVTPSSNLLSTKKETIEAGYNDCREAIESWKQGTLELKPGCTAEQTLENVLNGKLSRLREDLGDTLKSQLDIHNSPYVMAICGSKGSNINLSQMIACVGQQTVSGHRIPNGFFGRSLPHFAVGARTPAAKGFVSNSFYSGLTGSEFFFHTMGGREGLIDSAVKTAETGYMQRRLMKSLEDFSIMYDLSVRASNNQIAQFLYGDDGFEPMLMEDGEKPVNFSALLAHIRSTIPFRPSDPTDLPADESAFKTALKDRPESFFRECLANYLEKRPLMSSKQLIAFVHACYDKLQTCQVTPGEAVGAVAAQSIGEPGTQMTLKTFHFAGVASMNITLGVPRIKEIINAVKEISTPIISASLINPHEETAAKIAKWNLEKKTVKDVSLYLKEVYTPFSCYIVIKLNPDILGQNFSKINAEVVKQAIINNGRLKLKDQHIQTNADELRVFSPEQSREKICFSLLDLRAKLPNVIVSGIHTINRAVVRIDEKQNKYSLAIEGYGLTDVMRTPELDFRHCTTNHVMETETVLGIEAARATIINEIKYTLKGHGIYVDPRHIALLADVMTFKGQVLGITRFGVSKMRDSTLMLASFEKTTDHLCDAAYRGAADKILGVSEKIIMGKPVSLGTGICSLMFDYEDKPSRVPKRRNPLLLGN